jgi:hypothetical protein
VKSRQPKQRGAWRRRREKYLRDSRRHVELIREGYTPGHPAEEWALIVGRGKRTALERHAPGARLFVVGRDLNSAQAGAKFSHAGAKGSAEDTRLSRRAAIAAGTPVCHIQKQCGEAV